MRDQILLKFEVSVFAEVTDPRGGACYMHACHTSADDRDIKVQRRRLGRCDVKEAHRVQGVCGLTGQ